MTAWPHPRPSPPIVIDTLAAMVRYGTFYYGHCDACGHAAQLDMADLIRRLGPGYPAAGNDLGRRLVCTRCGQRGASVLVGTEAARRASPGGGVYGPSAFAEAPVAGFRKEPP